MALAKSQRSLQAWGKQKWTTKSGKPSSKTAAGKQFVKQPKSIANKVKPYRSFA
jgi:hypothetical protein